MYQVTIVKITPSSNDLGDYQHKTTIFEQMFEELDVREIVSILNSPKA